MSWSEFFDTYGTRLLEATWETIQMSLLSFMIAIVVGIVIVSFRVSPIPPLVKFATVFVSFFRNTPVLVLFFLAFFGLGELDFVYSGFSTAVVALGLYTGAYLSEALRSGINSVPQGQAEAGRAIGLNFIQLLTLIVIPQAVRTVVAPIGNLFIANAKNTAVALTISAPELTALSRRMINDAAGTWRSLLTVAATYTVLLLLAGWGFRSIETRVAIKR